MTAKVLVKFSSQYYIPWFWGALQNQRLSLLFDQAPTVGWVAESNYPRWKQARFSAQLIIQTQNQSCLPLNGKQLPGFNTPSQEDRPICSISQLFDSLIPIHVGIPLGCKFISVCGWSISLKTEARFFGGNTNMQYRGPCECCQGSSFHKAFFSACKNTQQRKVLTISQAQWPESPYFSAVSSSGSTWR